MADRGKILFATVGTGNIEDLEKTLLIPLKKSILKGEWALQHISIRKMLRLASPATGQQHRSEQKQKSCFKKYFHLFVVFYNPSPSYTERHYPDNGKEVKSNKKYYNYSKNSAASDTFSPVRDFPNAATRVRSRLRSARCPAATERSSHGKRREGAKNSTAVRITRSAILFRISNRSISIV